MDYTFGTKLFSPKTPAIAWLPSPHFGKGRRGHKLDLFVIHATECDLRAAVDWLRSPRRKTGRSSAHYIIDKNGATIQLVDEGNTAWHAIGRRDGRGFINNRSVGVELVNANDGKDRYTPAQLRACLALNVDFCIRNKIGSGSKYLAGHGDIDLRLDKKGKRRRTDPGPIFPWGQYRASLDLEIKRGKRNAKK